MNSPGFRMWHYKIYVHKCKFCSKEKIESDTPYNETKLKALISLRRRFLQEMQKRRVLVEIEGFRYGEMINFRKVQSKFENKYKTYTIDFD